jgi:hypothetical protein
MATTELAPNNAQSDKQRTMAGTHDDIRKSLTKWLTIQLGNCTSVVKISNAVSR